MYNKGNYCVRAKFACENETNLKIQIQEFSITSWSDNKQSYIKEPHNWNAIGYLDVIIVI